MRSFITILFLCSLSNSWSQVPISLLSTDDYIHELTSFDYDNDGNTCETIIKLKNRAFITDGFNCGDSIFWSIHIDLWADGMTDFHYASYLPASDNTFDDTNGDGIPDKYIPSTISNEEVIIDLPEITGGLSHHKVSWQVYDPCYNTKTANIQILVLDRSEPWVEFKVVDSLEVVDPYSSPVLNAEDFIIEAGDNCTERENLKYSFSSTEYIPTQVFMGHSFNDTITVYVIDERGNFAEGDIPIYNPNIIICDPPLPILGRVMNQNGNPIEGASALIEADLVEYPREDFTNDQGEYFFYNLPRNLEYTISLSFSDMSHSYITNLDLIRLQNHILGIETFTDPLDFLIADVNLDKKVNIQDLNKLRKIQLGIINPDMNDLKWRFVSETFLEEESGDILNSGKDPYLTSIFLHTNLTLNYVGFRLGNLVH